LKVRKVFGWRKALRLALTRDKVALRVLTTCLALFLLTVGIQSLGHGTVRIWHDLDGDGKADIAVTYVLLQDEDGTRLVEVERTDSKKLVNPVKTQ